MELDQEVRKKTEFISRNGLFEFKVLPFGLCISPATFERLVETVLAIMLSLPLRHYSLWKDVR